MNETARSLRTAMDTLTRDHHLPDAVVADAAEHVGRRPRRTRELLAVAACLVGVLVVAGAYALSRPDSRHRSGTASIPTCAASDTPRVLPAWAGVEFADPAEKMRYLSGERGQVVGVLFGDLRVHQPPGTNNKILWIARDGGGAPLVISARLHGIDATVTRTLENVGPSIVDMPRAGCWQFALTWPGNHDTVAVRYGD